jgi:hypothetical protein
MSSFSLHSAAVLALQAAIGLSAAGCVDIAAGEAQFVDTIEKRFAVSGTPILMVGTFDGSVEVSTWDRSEVLVTIERRAASREEADRMLITAEQSGDEIRVQVKSARPDGGFHFNFGSFNARVVVNVPTKARIDASTGDGRVYVRDVEGDLVARTGDGSIHLERVNGAIEASSGDGSITVDGQIQRLKARSGDGRVRVHAVGAAPTGDWSLSTGDGSVVLEVPDGFGAELDARTGDGHVEVQDVQFDRTSEERSRRVARGRIGNGGSKVTIRSGDGSIVVRRAGATD